MTARDTYHFGNLREALIETALARIEKGGFDKLSLRSLAAELKVAPSAPYQHFSSKLDLLSELATLAHARIYSDYEAILADPSDQSRIRTASDAYLDFARRSPHLFQVLFADDALWKREGGTRPTFSSSAFDLFVRIFAIQMPDIEDVVVRRRALAAWSMLHGFAILNLTGRMAGYVPAPDLRTYVIDLVEGLAR